MTETRAMVNTLTRTAMDATIGDYINKDMDEYALIAQLKEQYALDTVYRFDIGKNTDGFSPLIRETLELTDMADEAVKNLIEYPDNQYRKLRRWISDFYDIDPAWFVLSAGLEPMIDMIARVFLAPGDRFVLPVPNFFHFEEYSRRVGGEPVMIRLREEDGFRWTPDVVTEVMDAMKHDRVRLLWMSNPGNPTGAYLPGAEIDAIAAEAARHGIAVVVDEAYGEYTDSDTARRSACDLVRRHPHLMVLRTFSKMYGLPSLRVGYLVCSSPDILGAVNLYRPMFPFSWFSLHVAQIASVDQEFIADSRALVTRRRELFFEGLDALPQFEHTRSETNIFLLRHRSAPADDLAERLLVHGIIVANHNGITGIEGRQYVRVTVRSEQDNRHFVDACRAVFS